MRQVQISKRHRAARVWPEPLPPDARDPDIVRAKQLARRLAPPNGGRGRCVDRDRPQARLAGDRSVSGGADRAIRIFFE